MHEKRHMSRGTEGLFLSTMSSQAASAAGPSRPFLRLTALPVHPLSACLSFSLLFLASQAFAQSPVIGPAGILPAGPLLPARTTTIRPLPLVNTMIATDGPDYALDLTSLTDGILYGTDAVVCTMAPELLRARRPSYFDTANVMMRRA